ncbi:MAG TPA: hypothetical protein VK859_13955, partial [bacterium]|nr:hypothetical protein [bacterium]
MVTQTFKTILNRFVASGFLLLNFLILFPFSVNRALAQCTPTSATLCVSSDDNSNVYVGGTLIGNFPYAGAPGTGGAANPTCISVNPSLLTGTCVSIAVDTQNTAPQDTFSSWDLDITCSGGNHSEITSASGGLSVVYVPTGNPSTPPANDSGGNPWYSPNFNNSTGAFSSSYCSSGVTASTWAAALYNPVSGLQLPFIANNCSGDYGTSVGALFWRQCVPIPPPVTLIGPPSFTITKAQSSAVTNSPGANDLTIDYTITVCNTGGPVTNGGTTVTDNFLTNVSTCNNFQFQAWGYGDANCPYVLPYNNSCGEGNAPSVSSNSLIFPSFGHGCVTITAEVIDYYDPISSPGCGLTLVDQASLAWPGGTKTSGSVTYIQLTPTPTFTFTYTPTPTLTHTFTFTPTYTPTVATPTATYTNTFTFTPTNSPTPTHSNTFTNTPTNTFTNTVTNTFTPTPTRTNTPTNTPTNTVTLTPTPTNSPTATHTNTPTNSFTNTPTRTPTATPTNSPTPTPTNTTINTPTSTPTYTRTNTPTNTDSPTPTNSPTPTPTRTPTPTPS